MRLQNDFEPVGFFYNPNVHPEDEYYRRLKEIQRLSALWHLLVDTGEYEHGRFLELVRGLEQEPEGGRRCEVCIRMRLERAAGAARNNGCTVVASTLTIGPSKRAGVVNRLGCEAGARHGVRFLEGDWKKQDGFRRSVELSRGIGMYRQISCGCEFSQRPTTRTC